MGDVYQDLNYALHYMSMQQYRWVTCLAGHSGRSYSDQSSIESFLAWEMLFPVARNAPSVSG